MNEINIDFFNDYFGAIKDIKQHKKFNFNLVAKQYEGEIRIKSRKGDISFIVQIPETYPLNDLKFITKNFKGYPHQNFDGSLCLNTAFVNHLYTRLNLEIEKLREYISKYYEEEIEDEHYEYSAFEPKGMVSLLFDETDYEPHRFKTPFGDYKYSVLSFLKDDSKKVSRIAVIAQSLGNKDYSWAGAYKKKNTYTGCWVFLNNEPVQEKKLGIEKWGDLTPRLPENFFDYFVKFCRRFANYKLLLS